jgi:hypothetical protein
MLEPAPDALKTVFVFDVLLIDMDVAAVEAIVMLFVTVSVPLPLAGVPGENSPSTTRLPSIVPGPDRICVVEVVSVSVLNPDTLIVPPTLVMAELVLIEASVPKAFVNTNVPATQVGPV